MAVNLARSFWLWNSGTPINFYIATDMPQYLPADVTAFARMIPVQPGELGGGFSPKLHLDKLAPEGHTLFIDSDCLVYGNLEGVFEKFAGHSVSVVGGYISSGEWFGDVAAICKKFNVKQIPKFNGGIYYLEKGKKAAEIYQMARELETQYDGIGFVRLRNRPNDEVIIALAMAINDEKPVFDDGSVMSDPLSCPGEFFTDVIKGKAVLHNPPKPSPLHQDWYPFKKVNPTVVHFLGHYAQLYPYRREAYRLSKIADNKLGWVNNLKSLIFIEYPGRLEHFLRNTFRATYRRFFGVRKIKRSERIVDGELP